MVQTTYLRAQKLPHRSVAAMRRYSEAEMSVSAIVRGSQPLLVKLRRAA
ncbi:MAG: hypothetical protein AAF283_11515 [Cyanobacteria bacterium P01_A01_bin.70]